MPLLSLPPSTFISTVEDLQALCYSLAQEEQIAVDTESNSLYVYHGRLCLIQLSSRTADYIVDPLAIDNMSALGALMANPNVEKVFHAAEYDTLCMKRDYGIHVVNMFDTMYAARLVEGKLYGLAELLMKHYEIKPDKSHQLDNWGKRPLAESSLTYAQMDTHYLLPLRDYYMERVQEVGAIEELREIFNDITLADPKEQVVDPDGYWKLVKPKELNKRQLAILAELFLTRENIAEEMDVPPFKVIDNRVLVNMALQSPSNRRELGNMRGLRPEMVRIYADDLLDAIDRGHQNKPPQPPVAQKVDQPIADRYVVLHAWRKEKAIARKLESNMIISKTTLWGIAHKVPKTIEELSMLTGVGAWRLAAYGDEILNVLHKKKQP